MAERRLSAVGQELPRGQRLDPSLLGERGNRLREFLQSVIKGQNAVLDEIVQIFQEAHQGISDESKPVGAVLLLGPTGTGKTRTVQALAEAMHGSRKKLLRIDCGEFQMEHEVAKLIGSPPGYLGHKETSPLLAQDKVDGVSSMGCDISIVLFDELEKASDSLTRLLLGILDYATLSLGDNTSVDFSRCLIFLTSNVGALEMKAVSGQGLHYLNPCPETRHRPDFAKVAIASARRRWTPDFMNRLTNILIFHYLDEEAIAEITQLMTVQIRERLRFNDGHVQFGFGLTLEARRYVAREGYQLAYGARHLGRALQRLVVQPLANLLASKQIRTGDFIEIDFDGRALEFRKKFTALEPDVLRIM